MRDATAILLALSGGRDSVVLLDVLRPLCNARGIALSAAHVHHGLSPHAEEWASFCAALCTRHCVPLHLLRVDVGRGASTSIEAAARDARYRALAGLASTLGVQAVLLAQHADDQAETVLLQLARGAGPRGISAMPAARRAADGVAWLRPLLDVPRAAIDAHAAANALEYVDDDSNTSARFRRNALRQMVVPALRAIAPGYPHTLVRAAALAAEASLLADELAALDARDAFDGQSLARAPLAELAPHRARNLLRWYLRANGCRAPSAARLAQMLAQLAHASPDAQVELLHDGTVIGVYAGRVRVHAPPPPAFDCVWHGEPALVLAHGTLDFLAQRGAGLRAGMVGDARWSVRARSGGERLTLDRARPRRMLKALLQEAGLPAWERDVLPLLFCGDALAAVPGIGVDVAFRAEACGILVSWRAHPQNRATKTR
ncbi:MAG: tRNA lysidine(34) synthetase TilS [Casimicrobiaceae bacterium]